MLGEWSKRCGLVITAVALFSGIQVAGQPVSAQDESILLFAATSLCEIPPDQSGWTPEMCVAAPDIGIIFTTPEGDAIDTCTTAGSGKIEGGVVAAACNIEMPLGSTIIVTLDEATISDGYYLYSSNPQEFTAPDTLPDGVLSYPFFVILAEEVTELPSTGNAGVSASSSTPLAGLGTLALLAGGAALLLRRRDDELVAARSGVRRF